MELIVLPCCKVGVFDGKNAAPLARAEAATDVATAAGHLEKQPYLEAVLARLQVGELQATYRLTVQARGLYPVGSFGLQANAGVRVVQRWQWGSCAGR